MRSRPSLTVLISPSVVHPGQALDAEAVLESRSETPIDAVVMRLVGRENVVVGGGRNRREWSHLHLALEARHPAAVLTPGKHTYRARFDLPAELPPRYHGDEANIRYELEVRVDIPWWPDRVGRYDIPVVTRPAELTVPTPRVFTSSARGPRGRELYAELSLDSATVSPGSVINGTVSFANTQHTRVRRVTAAFVGFERVRTPGEIFVAGVDSNREVFRYVFPIHEGAPPEGQALPFRVRVPAGVVENFQAAFTRLLWSLEIKCETGWSAQVPLLAPLLVVPTPARGPARDELAPAVLPAVGNERRAMVWTAVAQQHGLLYDSAAEVARGSTGAVSAAVLIEQRGDQGLFTVARLSWPPLGIDLDVGPAGWTDRLSREEIDVGDAAFDARFRVRGRLPGQVRALLEADVRAALVPFPEVTLRDDGAAFAMPGAAVLENLLAPFVGATMFAARALDAAFARIPPPAALAPHVGAWRAYASRLNGRFEPGRVWIHDGAYGMERVAVGNQWGADGSFECTVVRVAIDPPLPAESFNAAGEFALPRAAAALHKELTEADNARVIIERDVVGVELSGAPAADPARLDPLLDKLARLSRALRGREDAGPFR